MEVGYVDSAGNIWVKAAYNFTRLQLFNSNNVLVGEIYNDQVSADRHIVTLGAPRTAEDSFIKVRATAPSDHIGSVIMQSELSGGGKVAPDHCTLGRE